MKPLHDQAIDIIIKAAKVRRDDLQHMATDHNKGQKEAALITAAIDYLEAYEPDPTVSKQEQLDALNEAR